MTFCEEYNETRTGFVEMAANKIYAVFFCILGMTGRIMLPNEESCGIKYPKLDLLAESRAVRCPVDI